MAILDFAHRELVAKVVYLGPEDAGTRTNLARLHEELPDAGALRSFGPADSEVRSPVFEVRRELDGFSLRMLVYGLPGALHHAHHRELVLRDVDALVFVADARPARAGSNVDALVELEQALGEHGRALSRMPTVLQVNQADREGAVAAERAAFDLNPYGFPVLSAAAASGVGVTETFDALAERLAARLRAKLGGAEDTVVLRAMHLPRRLGIEDLLQHHTAALAGTGDALAEYLSLSPGPEVEVPFQPSDYVGTRPVHLLHGQVEGDAIRLELVMERIGGGTPRRLTVRLANRPVDEPAVPRPTRAAQVTGTPSLALTVEPPAAPRVPSDYPPVWYGIAGLAGGSVCGLLLGFLLFG